MCGIAVCRDLSAKTLWQGWWGPLSLLITPVLLVVNLVTRIRLGRLAAPAPGAPGTPAAPGKPLFKRAAVLGLAGPVLIAAAIGWSLSRDIAFADVGTCIQIEGIGSNAKATVVDCADRRAEYVIVGKFDDTADKSRCEKFPESVASYTKPSKSSSMLLCLGEIP
ncbi:MAG TPA: hypothetical protein VFX61_09790 [Micromonosporaceae bacterium]|nr:hypothetical protein [Micromonosporaceae bacterium]